ncbi:MAG: prepilin peptidase [Firmicutes bacterium]|nr:prepilin peptidase [Bacillota bacterium]
MVDITDLPLIIGCLIPCIVIAFIDYTKYIIPNKLTYPMIIMGLLYAVYTGNISGALLGGGVCFAAFLIIGLLQGAGAGDIKMVTALGIWFGMEAALTIIFVASILGVVWGIAKMIRTKGKGEFLAWTKNLIGGLALTLGGAKGALNLPKLPEDDDAPAPETAIPFGAFLSVAAILLWVGAKGSWLN